MHGNSLRLAVAHIIASDGILPQTMYLSARPNLTLRGPSVCNHCHLASSVLARAANDRIGASYGSYTQVS